MSAGIEVANGSDVTKTAIKDQLFTSKALSIKNVIYKKGSIQPTSFTNSQDDKFYEARVVIPHNLGYEPVTFVYFRPGNFNSSEAAFAPQIADTDSSKTWGFIDNEVCTVIPDKENITIQFRYGQKDIDFDYSCFILVERT